jgi:hypothetical protein
MTRGDEGGRGESDSSRSQKLGLSCYQGPPQDASGHSRGGKDSKRERGTARVNHTMVCFPNKPPNHTMVCFGGVATSCGNSSAHNRLREVNRFLGGTQKSPPPLQGDPPLSHQRAQRAIFFENHPLKVEFSC